MIQVCDFWHLIFNRNSKKALGSQRGGIQLAEIAFSALSEMA